MQDVPIEAQRGTLRLSTDRRRVDPSAVLALLRTTFLGEVRSLPRHSPGQSTTPSASPSSTVKA